MESNSNSDKYANVWTLAKLFFYAFSLCHVVGTLYFAIGLIEINIFNQEDSWI
jgi:hypothetical protein